MEEQRHIVIDCFKLVKGMGKSLGIYNVALHLVQSLIAARPSAKITVLGTRYNREDFAIAGVNFVEIDRDPHRRLTCVLWELFTVSKVVKQLKADEVLFPRGFCALTHPVRDVVLVHDMIPFYYHANYPGYFNRLENFYIRWRLKASIRTAHRVITISEASKADILRYTKCDPAKINVILNGCDAFRYAGPTGGGGYFSAITSKLPHKNAAGIVKAYAAYVSQCDDPLPLELIGVPDIDAYTQDESLKARVTCHAYIKENEVLHTLIARSEGFLFLSLTEGFGLPPVEAMLVGAPVVCSDRSSLPEACGDAALYVDPEQPEGVAAALLSLQKDPVLRERLRERGYRNAQRFSWSSRAKLYWDVLDK